MNKNLLDLSILELSSRLKAKSISSVDLVSESYQRMEASEPVIHAAITIREKVEALAMAKKADDTRTADSHTLHGIPYVVKDAYITKGMRTTAASKILDNYIPPYNATVIDCLEKCGAILIGKMNMDAWGHGASTENTDYPVTKNPWDITRSAGGSGGGPAAAIALRYVPFAIGEDTGGSVRNPAAWCGTTGLKVTYGRVSRYGAIAYASSLDTVCPTAKTAEDCAVVLEAIAGIDPYDATSSPHPVDEYVQGIKESIKGKRIAFPLEYYKEGLDPEIKTAIIKAREQFVALGAIVEDVSMPLLEFGVPVYYILAPSETSSNLGRYDGVRYGGTRELFTKETRRRILTGTYALSSGYYDAYYKKAQKARSVFIANYKKVLSKYDAILSPVSFVAATKFGELLDDPVMNMMIDVYTGTVNIVGVPSLALPCGFTKTGLPIGMQLIGNMYAEKTLISLGSAYQEGTDWHKKIPRGENS